MSGERKRPEVEPERLQELKGTRVLIRRAHRIEETEERVAVRFILFVHQADYVINIIES